MNHGYFISFVVLVTLLVSFSFIRPPVSPVYMEMLTLDFMCLNGSVTFKSGSGADDESTGMGSVHVFHRIDLCHFSNISQ